MTNSWNTKKGAVTRRPSCGGAVLWCLYATLLTLAAVAFVSPAPAQAQTSIGLVSTLGGGFNKRAQATNDEAQAFTTGTNPNGYKLTSVEVQLGGTGNTPCSYDASVWSDSGGTPNTRLAGLTTPSISGMGVKLPVFSATGNGIDLDPSQSYAIVIRPSSGNAADCSGARLTNSDSEAGAAGWSVNDSGRFKQPAGSWTTDSAVLLMRVNGYAIPNTAPTASDNAVTTVQDTAYSFGAADFNFSDTDTGASLSKVSIETLPASGKGTLKLDTADVTAGQEVSRADIDAGKLTYTPPSGESGDSFASFTFKVSDGTDFSTTANTMTINVTPPPLVLTFSVAPTTIPENAGMATVTVSTGAGPTSSTDQTITLTLAGTATKGTDYSIASESLTLLANSTSVTTTITATNDGADDDNETILISASVSVSGTATPIGSQQTVTISQTAPTLSVSLSADAIAEAAGTSTVTVTASGSTFSTDQTIALVLSGTATKTADYTISPESLTLTLLAGATSVTATVTAVQDNIDDDAETVLITASHNNVTFGTQQTVTITDDDDAPTLSVSLSPAAIAEAAGTSTVTVTASGSTFSTDQTIALVLSGTATKTADYTISPESLTLTLLAGATSVTATVTAVQDNIDDDAETVLITASHNNVTFGTQQTVTITDDDDAPTLTVGVSSTAIAEAAGSSTVTVSTGGTTFATDQTIALALAGTATKTADYNISAESLTLLAGATSVTATVTAVDDLLDDDAETVLITASHNSVTFGTQQTVTITDDDGAPMLTVSASPATIAEAAGTSTVTVTASGSTFTTNQTIALALAGTATKTADYNISAESLTLLAGATSVTATVTAVQDSSDEPDETVLITASVGGSTIGTQQTVTIRDDDDAPTLSVTVNPDAIAEAAGTSTVTVTATGTTFTNQTIALALAGTATKTADYNISAESLTLLAGETSVTATVTAVQDSSDEPDETVLITASVGGSTIGTQQTVTIRDDDDAPTLTVRVDPATIAEAAGTSTVTVTASGSTFTTNQTIALALAGTATKTADYNISAESLTLTAGATSVTATVTAVDDLLDDDAETVVITASHNSINIGTQQTVTITDDDNTRIVSIAGTDANESAGNMVFTISVSETSPGPVSVGWAAAAGEGDSAEPEDFTASSGTATIVASQTSTTVSVPIVNDMIHEAAETIRVNLGTVSATGVTVALGPASDRFAEASILNDDPPPSPTISVDNASIAEAGGQAVVTIGTGSGSTFESDMEYVLTLSGAGTRMDYTIGQTTLTLSAGVGDEPSMVTTTLTAIQDRIDEPNEAIVLTAAVGSVTVTVTDDDDAPVPTFTVDEASIDEAAGSATLTVSTGSGSTFEQAQTIVLSLGALGTATEVHDFNIQSKTLTLPAGVGTAPSSITTTVTAVQDKIDEPNETILIDAKRGTGGSAPAVGSQLTVTVTDDDAEPLLTFTTNNANIAEEPGRPR